MTTILSSRTLIVAGLLAGLFDVADRASATVAVAAPASPVARSGQAVAAPAVTRVVPLSASSVTVAAVPPVTSDFVRPAARTTPFRRMAVTPILGGLNVAEVALIGTVMIGLTSYARRRHRRRIGWAFLPDRPICRMRSNG